MLVRPTYDEMDFEYTVSQRVYRNRSGQALKIEFEFDETITVVLAPNSIGTIRQNREKRYRTYTWGLTRDQYETWRSKLRGSVGFDLFITALSPIIMGHYKGDELERAFAILDRDYSRYIDITEFSAILQLLNESVNVNTLRNYMAKIDGNFYGILTYEKFQALVLHGLGRDIMCNHI